MLDIIAAAVIIAGLPLGVYAYRRHAREMEPINAFAELRPRPRPPRWPSKINRYVSGKAIDLFEEASEGWWPAEKVWGRTHRPHKPPYNWQTERPPAVVGSGRGHAL